ncbi:MAG: hypothetical protein LPK88_02940 [Alphaproteobacteria bacterium]|nr:hypothetical protein [Alphaproteobacteria bacterium]MDX5415266.1 hypothetical protein [Alphaproteobacteria bacterium]MDX5492475.1 hypothetical protein [Alphaproteobacteria bacterium]
MTKPGLAVPLVGALLLAACAEKAPDLAPLVQIAPPSCASQPDLGRALPVAFHAEEKTEPVTVTITEQSPCLAEDGSKSLYEVFALPSVAHSIIVTVRSLPSTSGILAPRIVTLDAEGNRIRQVDRESIHFRGKALTAMLRTRPEEKYMLVTSDADVVGGDISRVSGAVHQQMISSGAFMVAVYTGSESVASMTYAHNGTVEVSARPIPVAK